MDGWVSVQQWGRYGLGMVDGDMTLTLHHHLSTWCTGDSFYDDDDDGPVSTEWDKEDV